MADPRSLEKRVAELEAEVARLRRQGPRGVRRRSPVTVLGLPVYDIAIGPDPEKGELRGHAKGFIAIGDFATGVIALGGVCRGVIALGGLAVGVVSIGGVSLGLLLGLGGLALGGGALGGFAVGGAAVGGFGAGYYACGGQAYGHAVVTPVRVDPEAQEFFARYGLQRVCRPR
jgi:hypothetical protein